MIPIPDLLAGSQPADATDPDLLAELLEMAFLGRERTEQLDAAVAGLPVAPSPWRPELFRQDLFLDEMVERCLTLRLGGREHRVNARFLARVLASPPADLETVRFRQGILRELAEDARLRAETESLYRGLNLLLSMFKASRSGASLDVVLFRLDVMEQTRKVIDSLVTGFAGAGSGLRRLHDVGREIQASNDYRVLCDLLDYESQLARLRLRVRLGADGRLRGLEVDDLVESTENPFYRPPWRRALTRLRMMLSGLTLDRGELVKRLIFSVYQQLAPSLRRMVQLAAHLEVYLTALDLKQRAAAEGLAMTLPEVAPDAPLELRDLFNPLLLGHDRPPVPNLPILAGRGCTTLVTGPNSGGKTRLLQALGLSQILGQSGLFVPASHARLPLVEGLFASLLQHASPDQSEGRLGTELVRIRTLFESVGTRSLVILDELCSGTNPSEAVDILSMVLTLLERLGPTAFISTHFLDYTRRLAETPPVERLVFLQAEIGPRERPTYQFLPGVAATSLAAATARRLGVTVEELTDLVDRRRAAGAAASPQRIVPD